MDPDLWTYCGVIYDCFFMMYLINNEYTAKGEQPFRESFVWMIKMRRQSYIILPGNGNIFRESCLHLRC